MPSPGSGGVAQLGEHLLCKQGVVGSSPITSTTTVVLEVIGCVAEKPKRSALLVRPLGESGRNRDAGGASGWRRRPPGKARGMVFVRVNQVLVRLWALPSQVSGSSRGQGLTGRCGVPTVARVFRGDCCVLSESDPRCAGSSVWSVTAEDGFCAWWRSPDASPGHEPVISRGQVLSERRAFGGCLGTRRR